jgi:hypothetical protein
MKCLSLHINENYRGFVVRKLKSMDWDRIRIFLEAARIGMRVNRQQMVEQPTPVLIAHFGNAASCVDLFAPQPTSKVDPSAFYLTI